MGIPAFAGMTESIGMNVMMDRIPAFAGMTEDVGMTVGQPMTDAERLNFSFVLPGRLAGLAWPFPRREPADAPALLRAHGITQLVNLSGEPYPEDGRTALTGIELIDEPVDDYCPPDPEQADRLWARLASLPAGSALALHCAAGMGRTGTLLACLLGRELGLDGAAAVARVRALRPGSVETLAQEEMVDAWLRTHPDKR
jgi:atypical dual specificity phosphatase